MNAPRTTMIAAFVLLPLMGFSQAPPNPPNPPSPPASPGQPGPPPRREKPKVPVTFLGVETSPVPPVVCEQLALAKGFGLVVDYVVPDSPAAAAGLQQNDILKLLNDQILTEPDQLSKLVRSYAEGTNITLTVLRKGQEQKINVKLTKKEVPQRREFGRRGRGFGLGDMDFGDLRDQMDQLKEQLGDANQGVIHDAVMKAHEQVQRVREEAERARERAREEAERVRDQARDEAERARDQAQEERERARERVERAGQEIKVTRADDTGLKTTTIDLGKAQIVCSDQQGELRIDNANGKKMLTAKDPKGMLLFSGPVETREDMDKIPAPVRERFDKLQQNDLPSVVTSDENNDDDDSADIDDEDDDTPSPEQICVPPQLLSRSLWAFRTILI